MATTPFRGEQIKNSEIYYNFLVSGPRKLILGSKVLKQPCLYTLQENFLLYFYQLGSYFPKTRFDSEFYSIFSNYVIVKQLMKYRTLIPEQQASISMLLTKCRVSIVIIFIFKFKSITLKQYNEATMRYWLINVELCIWRTCWYRILNLNFVNHCQ